MHFCEEFYCLFIAFFSAHPLFSCHISSFVNLFIPRAFICFHIYQSLHIPLLLMHLKQLFASLCIRLPQFGLLFFWHLCQSFKSHPSRTIYLCPAWVFLFVRLSHESLHVQLSISSFTTPPVPCWQTPPYGHTHTHTCWLRSKPVGCGAGRGWCWGAVRGTNGLGTMKTYQ